jgi:hypothetical protein
MNDDNKAWRTGRFAASGDRLATSNDQELMNVPGRHTDYDTVADLPPVGDLKTAADADSLHEAELANDPFDDDLADRLQTRAPRKKTPRTTMALAGIVVLVGGFVGGILVQKNFGTTTTTANTPGGTGGFGGFGGGQTGGGTGTNGGQAGTGAAARNATTGTVKLVDGTTLYITTADGSVVTVKTSGTTAVRSSQSAALKDIPAGATVTIQGTTGSDGTVTATQVTAQK